MDLKAQLAAEIKAATDITEQAHAENRDLTDTEAKSFDEHLKTAEELKERIASYQANSKKLDALVLDETSVHDGEGLTDANTMSERFVKSKPYATYHRLVEQNLDSRDISIAKTRVGNLDEFYSAKYTSKAGNALTSALALSQPQRLPMVDLVERPQITLLDLITRGRIDAESIEYLQILSVTRNTAIVPENTGDDTADTLKPESTFATSLAKADVYDYADGYTVTNKMLRDSSALATYLNSEFRYSFDAKIADVLLNGTGTNGQPKGLLNTTGVQAGEYSKAGDEAMNLVKAIRRSLTKLRRVGAAANAILVNPEDAEKIDLMQDADSRFYGNGPWGTGPTTVWGRPLVESEQVAAGKVIVGDFRQIALLDRTGLSIEAFNQHKDYAQRNLVYVRAELAAAQAIWRPKNFVVLEGKNA